MCLLTSCDIPSSPFASSGALKGTVELEFPRENNRFSVLVWHCNLWGRAKIWMRFIRPSAFFQVGQALTSACLLQMNSVYAKWRWTPASPNLRDWWLSCVIRRHDAYQFGTHRNFKRKRAKFIRWFEASHLWNCGNSLSVPYRICQESRCTLQCFAASVAGSNLEVNSKKIKHFGSLLLLLRSIKVWIKP